MTRRTPKRPRAQGGATLVRLAEGELRRVSILFADILNSTSMVQHLDPEAAADLLDPPLDAMKAAVSRYGGIVSHLGDGVLAVFGAPSACEDHAVRACLAGLAIQDALAELATVRARIGIHTGEVVMRERRIGRAQIWEPVGPAITVAARIEQSAAPGAILLSAATIEYARGFVATTPVQALAAKGFDQPLQVARLLGAEPGASRWTVRAAQGLVELVGRTAELRLLQSFLNEDHGPGVPVFQLHGDPGVGKSRLLHEALRSLAPGSAYVVHLAGDPHRRDAAFHAFGVWLRGWLDIRAHDAPEVARQQVAERTRRVAGLSEPGRAVLLRMLGLGPPGAGEGATSDTSPAAPGAMLSLWRQDAGRRRIILACEDLDCLDAASTDLLAAVMDAGQEHDLLIATTSRTRVRLPGAGPSHTAHLLPLGAAGTQALLSRIDARFADRPELAAKLHEKTGGNPLFIEEIGAKAVLAIDADPDAATLAAEPDQLPDRVEALIADRLRRLPRALRNLVQLCAVVGETVPLRLTAQLAGIAEASLHPQLLRLQAEQILTETRRYPDPEFAFRHGLTRDAAYRTILVGRRRELHRRACDQLEQDGPGLPASPLDDLCSHALGAQDWTRAVTHMRSAASLAAEKSAYQVARSRLQQALAASHRLPDDDGRARTQLAMLLDMRVLLNAAGRYTEVAAALDQAERLAQRLSDHAAIARIAIHRVHLLNIAGRMEEAVLLGREACATAEAAGDPALLLLASHNLAQAYYNQGYVRAAAAVLADAVARLGAADATHHPGSLGSLAVMVHVTHALSLAFAGRDRAAQQAADAARSGARATARPYDLAFACVASGMARMRTAPDAAAEALHEGIAVCETSQIAQAVPALQAALGHLMLRSGNWAGAASWLAKAYAASFEQTRSMVMCWAAAGLGRALWSLGDHATAAGLAAEAVETARQSGYRGYLAVVLRLRAALLCPAEAKASLQEAEALATELGLAGELADCRAALADLSLDTISPGG